MFSVYTSKPGATQRKPNRLMDRHRAARELVGACLLLGALLGAPPAGAAITNLQAWSLVYGGAAPPATWTYTVPAGSNANRLLVVAVAANRTSAGSQTATVTYGGQSLALQVGDDGLTGVQQHSWLFSLNEAGIDAATSTNLAVSVTGGTLNYLHVYAAVYDGVCQSAPITDSRNYNSGTTEDTAVGPFAPALTIASGDVAVEVVNLTRNSNNQPARTIATWASDWTQRIGPNSDPSGEDRQSAYVASNSAAGSTTSEHTASGNTWDSMSAMSMAAATAPTFTSASNATFVETVSGAFAVTASGCPAPTLAMSGTLPSGVTFTPATGLLAGTPAAGTAGTYFLTFVASNPVTPNATQSFTLTVVPVPPVPAVADSTLRQQYMASSGGVPISQGTLTDSATGTPTITFSHAVGAAAADRPAGNSLLLVGVSLAANGTGATVSGVTYGGNPLTSAGASTSGNDRVELWYRLNPTAGTANVVVTINRNTRTVSAVAAARTFEGVSTTVAPPLGTAVSLSGTSATPSTGAVSLQPGRIAFGVGLAHRATLINVQDPAGQFIEWHEAVGTTSPVLGWSAVRPTLTETSVTLGATLNASAAWIMVARSILSAAELVPWLSASSGTLAVGDTFTYAAGVMNRGDDPATNVQLTATVPAGITVTSATGCTIAGSGPTTVTCPSSPIASLAARASRSWLIDATTSAAGSLQATATVATTTTQSTANDTARELVAVHAAGTATTCATGGAAGGTITGVVNSYRAGTANAASGATSISVGTRVGAAVDIAVGDLLLVIQMQGTEIDSSDDSRYGNGVQGGFGIGSTDLNRVGAYEFVRAASALAGAGTGTLTIAGNGPAGGLVHSYTNAAATATAGQKRFQVVRVPQYTTVTLNGVTATPWSTTTADPIGLGTGGVVAIRASGAMTLGANSVDVSGQGFRGGGEFTATGAVLVPPVEYRTASSNNRNGVKGEGIAGTPFRVYVDETTRGLTTNQPNDGYPNGSTARGAPGNAGGGGTDTLSDNQWNTGGGGGGNGGAGGWGGLSWDDHRPQGGAGGAPVPATTARLFMGGGGGGGSANNYTSNAGARGGGIVILSAGSIAGTGAVRANGGSAASINSPTGSRSDGAGGGGAGGTVLVSVESGGLGGLTIEANGGAGGLAWPTRAATTTWPEWKHGPGGGGGGGIVFTRGASAPASVSVTGGANGTTNTSPVADPYGAQAGYVGAPGTGFSCSLPGSCAADPAVTSITHSGTVWSQGSTGNHIYVNVSNAASVVSTSGTTTVQITLPTSPVQLTPTAVTGGADWSCSVAGQVVTCTSTVAKAPGSAFTQIDITVSVGTYSGATALTVPAVITGWGTNHRLTNDAGSDSIVILSPTVAHVAQAWAVPMTGGVCLSWTTSFESANLGFRVWRESGKGRELVTPDVIAGSALTVSAGLAPTPGKPYRFLDRGTSDLSGAYWLEDLDVSGLSTWHGPVVIDRTVPKDAGCAAAPTLAELGRLPERPVPSPSAVRAGSLPAASSAEPIPSPQLGGRSERDAAVKIGIRTTGWYRVTREELLAAGLDLSNRTDTLQLTSEGVEYPFLVETASTDKDGGSPTAIQFYGFGIDSPFTWTRVFLLSRGDRPGQRLTPGPGQVGRRLASAFPAVVERKDRTLHFAGLVTNGEGENFFGPVVSASPTAVRIGVVGLEPSGAVDPALTVRLQGVTFTAHEVVVALNGVPVGTMAFSDREVGEATMPVPVTLLREGENEVTLAAAGDAMDYSLVDVVRLRYPRSYAAERGSLEFSLRAGERALVNGFTSPRTILVDVTRLDRISLLTTSLAASDRGLLEVGASQDSTFLAVSPESILSPVSVVPDRASKLSSTGNQAQILVVAPRSMLHAAEAYQAFRRAGGWSVAVADVEDVFDEFSYGHKSPWAIRDLIARTRSWRVPPTYVLLLGDASVDPKNYLGFGDFDYVPTKQVATVYVKTASDDWLADLNGDGLAEVAVGRMPARSEAEGSLLVSKTISFEQEAGQGWKRRLTFVSDRDDPGFSFSAASQRMQEAAGPGYEGQQIAVGTLGEAGARSALLAALNAGSLLTSFFGHGSQQLWRGLLGMTDAGTLTNGTRLPLVTAMTCLNGLFHDVYGDSLAEQLLRSPNGGAVAVWASSTLTPPGPQADAALRLISLVLGSGNRLGDAVRAAKSATADSDVRRSWILLGDPVLSMR